MKKILGAAVAAAVLIACQNEQTVGPVPATQQAPAVNLSVLQSCPGAVYELTPGSPTIMVGQTVTLTIPSGIRRVAATRWVTERIFLEWAGQTDAWNASVRGISPGAQCVWVINGRQEFGAAYVTVVEPWYISVTGPQSIARFQSQQYTTVVSGTPPAGTLTYQWRTRMGNSASMGAWQNYYTTSGNSTFISVSSCGVSRVELESRVTAPSGTVQTANRLINVSNPC